MTKMAGVMSPLHTGLAVSVTVLWGFTFVAIKVGLGEFPPLLFVAFRYIVVAVPTVLFVPRQNMAWGWIIAVGMTMGVLQNGLLYMGLGHGMSPGLSSLLLQSQALFTLLFSTLILRDVPRRQQWLGLGLALAGMGTIALDRGGNTPLFGLTLILAAAAAWAMGNICIKLAKINNGFQLFAWMSVIPPLPLLGLSAWLESGQWTALRSLSWLGIGTMLYTGLISSLLCFGFWAYLVQRYSPNRIAPFSLLVPVFGMAFTVSLLGDSFSRLEMMGSVLVFIGLSCTILTPTPSAAITPTPVPPTQN